MSLSRHRRPPLALAHFTFKHTNRFIVQRMRIRLHSGVRFRRHLKSEHAVAVEKQLVEDWIELAGSMELWQRTLPKRGLAHLELHQVGIPQ